jgi:hypothetical protein
MVSWRAVRREHLLAVVAEYDELGQAAFLERYGFRPARAYLLMVDGKSYDSKAVLGAAYRRATGKVITYRDFSGGVGSNGAATALRRLGFEVVQAQLTDVRRPRRSAASTPYSSRAHPTPYGAGSADVILVGCVKTKLSVATPAADLYVSALFGKRRSYAETTGKPWYILSALNGLVRPDTLLEPYDMHLASQPVAYRREWGKRVIHDLESDLGSLAGILLEIHAGAAYVDPLESVLHAHGASVLTPFRGLTQGEHLAWYSAHLPGSTRSRPPVDEAVVASAAEVLISSPPAAAKEFPWARSDLDAAGLYAWWVDTAGAGDLGLDATSALTLAYTGQAGATKWPSGKRSDATLRSRISRQHLGGDIYSSTMRQTFAALLRDHLDLRVVAPKKLERASEARLSRWIRAHLWATVWSHDNRDALLGVEEHVNRRLDAPFNLAGTGHTELRLRLSTARGRLQRGV